MDMRKLRGQVLAGMMAASLFMPGYVLAAEQTEETAAQAEAMVQAEDSTPKPDKHESKDAKKLQQRIKDLEAELEEQNLLANDLWTQLEDLKDRQAAIERGDSVSHGYPATSNYLVEPGYDGNVSYTQDAINAQGDSTMVFSYSPSQLYKIYCKLNYLTDIALAPGEAITFVGGGDTGQWMLDSATIDGTAHLYLKPIAHNAKTNIIINTTYHSYQVLCEEGDWYNPMIKWSYGSEEIMKSVAQQKLDANLYTTQVANTDSLNFDYKIKGKADWKPERVFDDGHKTVIQFSKALEKMPVLFVKEKGHKEASLVNYKTRNNAIVVERTFAEAELRLDNEVVTIKARR